MRDELMRESTPTSAVDPVQRQLRQVRRRRNLHELQRALYLLIAGAAVGGTLLVLFALRASERLFAFAAWSLGATTIAAALLLARAARRRWVSADGMAPWIDRRGALAGRLATLVELRARPPRPADAFFLPLLLEENVRRLRFWRPERLVPRRVPRGALAAAIATVGALLLTIVYAPALRPHFPEVIFSDRPVEGGTADVDDAAVADRVIVAPAARDDRSRQDGAQQAGPGADESDDRSALARLPAELQERIRRELWGQAWERMQEAMAQAREEAARASDSRAGSALDDEEAASEETGEEWEEARLPSGRPAPDRQRRHEDAGGGARRADGSERDPTRNGEEESEGTEETVAGSERAAGAGNDTDPNLFGAPSAQSDDGADTFELGIAAPIRTRQNAPRQAAGEAPPADPDGRPVLAANQRREHTIRKMPVPPAYEAIVREVFAHRPVEGDARP